MVPVRPQWTDQRIRHGTQGLLRPSDGSGDSAGRTRLKTEGKPGNQLFRRGHSGRIGGSAPTGPPRIAWVPPTDPQFRQGGPPENRRFRARAVRAPGASAVLSSITPGPRARARAALAARATRAPGAASTPHPAQKSCPLYVVKHDLDTGWPAGVQLYLTA